MMGPTKEEQGATAHEDRLRAILIAAGRAREAGPEDTTLALVDYGRDTLLTKRPIPTEEAREAFKKFENHFWRRDPRPRVSIPAKPDEDDDLILSAYFAQQELRSPSPAGAMREALEWYASEAEAIAARLHGNRVSQEYHAVEASLTVLALDGGKRARAALSTPSAPALDREAVIDGGVFKFEPRGYGWMLITAPGFPGFSLMLKPGESTDQAIRTLIALASLDAAAAAALSVIEECAKVAESVADIQSDACFADFARDIAAHIRALSHPSPEGG